MLDVRSFAVYGRNCDLLGNEQWKWFEEQLNDQTPVALTIVTSGIQVKCDIFLYIHFAVVSPITRLII